MELQWVLLLAAVRSEAGSKNLEQSRLVQNGNDKNCYLPQNQGPQLHRKTVTIWQNQIGNSKERKNLEHLEHYLAKAEDKLTLRRQIAVNIRPEVPLPTIKRWAWS
jgi:hypothetical protein